MLGSAGQNVIALTDSMFLYHYSEHDFAAIGIISVFYLIISSVAYGFSKGGHILIARKFGERQNDLVKKYFFTLCICEFLLGTVLFVILRSFPEEILSLFIKSRIILDKSLEFLHYRLYGLFFSYLGLAFFALYMGISKSKIIFINTLFLGITNIILCFILVYGKFGFPSLGIGGAGLASSIAEAAAFLFFFVYLVFDKQLKFLNLNELPKLEIQHVFSLVKVSLPILLQTIIGIASWFGFFVFIEKLGERALSISNLLRILYLVFTIPSWGFALSINTIISKTIGRKKEYRVVNQIVHGAILSLIATAIITFPFLFFPNQFLSIFFGGPDNEIFKESVVYFSLLYLILIVASFCIIIFNGVSGTGETLKAMIIQCIASFFYLVVCFISVTYSGSLGLYYAWCSEIVYWLLQGWFSWNVIKSGKWLSLKL